MVYIPNGIKEYMKFESTQAESSFGLLVANLTTIVLGAFGNFEQTIQQLTEALEASNKKVKELEKQIDIGPIQEKELNTEEEKPN